MKVEELKRALEGLPDDVDVSVCTAHMYHFLEKVEMQRAKPTSVPKILQPSNLDDAVGEYILVLGRW